MSRIAQERRVDVSSSNEQQPEPWRIRLALRDKLAEALGERELAVRWQLYRVVLELGGSACVELLRQTLETEQRGGMRTHDGTRRRTRGGVFFYLCKQRMTTAQRARVFPTPADRRKRKQEARATIAATATGAAFGLAAGLIGWGGLILVIVNAR